MRRLTRWLTLAGCVAVLGVAGPAYADNAPPSAERLRSAGNEYDAGRRAFGDHDYEEAATHFENAFNDAPKPEALRNAILARKKAGQLARAATLAALASSLYPETRTTAVIHEVLTEGRAKLDRVTLHCTPACGVAADGRAISPADATETIFFLDPGSHEIVASWGEDRSKNATVVATAGGQEELTYEAPAPASPAPFTGTDNLPPPPPPLPPRPSTGITPVVFIVGAVVTAGALGTTIWSGIDTLKNPGADKVKADCKGQGTNCPEYQQGLSSQLRTNVLIGVTSGVGAITAAIGIFFTRWGGSDDKATPRVDAFIAPLPGGGAVGVSGHF